MPTIDTVVIGAGHAGLAVSRLLTDAGRDHVVLDRGRVGERWRSERWDSLRLLTPSWMTRLPGWAHTDPDPEGFVSVVTFVERLERYAGSFGAPVVGATTVRRMSSVGAGYRLLTDDTSWTARNVVIATGPHGRPHVPAGLERTDLLTADRYRNPEQLPAGGVLVVGASSSGVQIADELVRAGRRVVLSVGRHTRMPRRYRGMDAFWWLEATGRLARTIDEVPDPRAARSEPSLQLVGGNADLDLASLQRQGVRLVGRVLGVSGRRILLGDNLAHDVAASERTMHRFLDAVDRHVQQSGLSSEMPPGTRPAPLDVPRTPRSIHLGAEGISTVLVAAGYRADHGWLRLPLTGPDGQIRQRQGRTDAPGVYVVGQRFQHRRDSGLIDGARHDAHAVVEHLLGGGAARRAALAQEPVA